MSHDALKVVDWFIAWNEDDWPLASITTEKMYALLYYAQGHHLGLYGTPLYKGAIEANHWGLVIPSLSLPEKQLRYAPIVLLSDKDFDFNDFTEKENKFLVEVWKTYGPLMGSELTQQVIGEYPWLAAYHNEYDATITHTSLRGFFVPIRGMHMGTGLSLWWERDTASD